MRHRLLALASLMLAISSASVQAEEAPDRIFVNARVWTAESAHPAAEAFAVAGDRFVAVGTEADVRTLAGPDTRVVNLGGRRVLRP